MRDRTLFAIALPAALLAACALAPPAGPRHVASRWAQPSPEVQAASGSHWSCTLSGAQALPPNSSLASGACDLSLQGGRVHAALTWRDLSMPALQVEFHGPAGPGEVGPLLWSFAPDARGPRTSSPVEADFELSHAQADLLRDGSVYVDVRTAMHPGGEIRGRLTERAAD